MVKKKLEIDFYDHTPAIDYSFPSSLKVLVERDQDTFCLIFYSLRKHIFPYIFLSGSDV